MRAGIGQFCINLIAKNPDVLFDTDISNSLQLLFWIRDACRIAWENKHQYLEMLVFVFVKYSTQTFRRQNESVGTRIDRYDVAIVNFTDWSINRKDGRRHNERIARIHNCLQGRGDPFRCADRRNHLTWLVVKIVFFIKICCRCFA